MIEMTRSSGASGADVKVIGVGGCGGNILNTMIQAGLTGVEFIACNTDRQALDNNMASKQLQLGQGLGAGGKPDVGRLAAEESKDEIERLIAGANMVFVTAGMGGGTGTGAAPVIARMAREAGALTVAIVTRPFNFEGNVRMRQADEGIRQLAEHVDSLITIPNQKLLGLAGKNVTMKEAFKKSDEVLLNAVQSISDIITIPGDINLDFADVRSIMQDSGSALMGTGIATGETRAVDAANMAISHPLMEDVQIQGAVGVLINVTGPSDMTLFEAQEAAELIKNAASPDANIIFGTVSDERMGDAVRITVIATGFPDLSERGVKRDLRNLSAQPIIGGKAASPYRAASPAARVPRDSRDRERVVSAPFQGKAPADHVDRDRKIVRVGAISDMDLDEWGDPQLTLDPMPRAASATKRSSIGGIARDERIDYEKPTYLRRSAD